MHIIKRRVETCQQTLEKKKHELPPGQGRRCGSDEGTEQPVRPCQNGDRVPFSEKCEQRGVTGPGDDSPLLDLHATITLAFGATMQFSLHSLWNIHGK
jgi:hypothetical protein